MTTTTMCPGRMAAFDQAVAAWHEAVAMFALATGTGGQMRAAEAAMRAAGLDEAAGLVTIPVGACHFSDVRDDGARMAAVSGDMLGPVWVCWRGRCFRHGVEARDYPAGALIQVRHG